jgi:hypothetical protein
MALLFFCYSFGDQISTYWAPLTLLPFTLLYLRDLKNSGYKMSDFLRVYALNIMLVPVMVGGLLKSIEQIITGRKIPFGRTPKVPGRTSAPALYSVIEVAMPLLCAGIVGVDIREGHWGQAMLALSNSAFLIYALVYFMGVMETAEDIAAGAKAAWNGLESRTEEWGVFARKLAVSATKLRLRAYSDSSAS